MIHEKAHDSIGEGVFTQPRRQSLCGLKRPRLTRDAPCQRAFKERIPSSFTLLPAKKPN